ncbi:hypothetical protein [Fodinibius sp.]
MGKETIGIYSLLKNNSCWPHILTRRAGWRKSQ